MKKKKKKLSNSIGYCACQSTVIGPGNTILSNLTRGLRLAEWKLTAKAKLSCKIYKSRETAGKVKSVFSHQSSLMSNRENPKHHVVATIRKLRPDKNSPTVRVSLPRLPHDILDFSFCPLPRVLHVTLANWQGFGFEFHLRSSPSEFEGVYMISRSADYYIICYTVLKRCNKVETADHGRNSWLSVWTLSCRCPVKLTT